MKVMSNLRNRLRQNLINNKKGQGTTEYIMLVVVVIGLVVLIGPKIKTKIQELLGKAEAGIDEVRDTN